MSGTVGNILKYTVQFVNVGKLQGTVARPLEFQFCFKFVTKFSVNVSWFSFTKTMYDQIQF